MKYIYDMRLNRIKLTDSSSSSKAEICLDHGGSLQKLTLNNITVIDDLYPLKYDTTYASAILFPFANRIKQGVYTFKQKTYKLKCNEKENNNAIHGLIYNRKFNVINKELSTDFVSVTLGCSNIERVVGFPFLYAVFLTYTLFQSSIKLKVTIKNLDKKPFPFTIGWHPYFLSNDLYNSYLNFESSQKIAFDEKMITTSIQDIKTEENLQILDKKFDDCYILKNSEVKFQTPLYNLEVSSSSDENYLQIYTPNKPNTIAIEPSTGPSNSFNNKLGLQVLNAGKSYDISWTIKLNKND